MGRKIWETQQCKKTLVSDSTAFLPKCVFMSVCMCMPKLLHHSMGSHNFKICACLGLKKLGYKTTGKKLDHIMKELDVDQDGRVEFTGVCVCVCLSLSLSLSL